MNEGLQVPGRGEAASRRLPKTNFFVGCVGQRRSSEHERELVPQYFKLLRKIRSRGAVDHSAVGLRHAEVPRGEVAARASRGLRHIPIIGNVYRLRQGHRQGCSTDGKTRRLRGERRTPGNAGETAIRRGAGQGAASSSDELAAKQLAVFKGLGFARPATWAGSMKPETASAPSSTWPRATAPDDWRDFLQGDSVSRSRASSSSSSTTGDTGLERSRADQQATTLRSLAHPSGPRPGTSRSATGVSHKVHRTWPSPAAGGSTALIASAVRPAGIGRRTGLAEPPGPTGRRAAGSKFLGFTPATIAAIAACPDCEYLCPLVQRARNAARATAPAADRSNGRCELDDKECFWARVYERMK